MGLPSMEGVAGDVAVAQVRGAVLLLFSELEPSLRCCFDGLQNVR